jgi:hypothetical protein
LRFPERVRPGVSDARRRPTGGDRDGPPEVEVDADGVASSDPEVEAILEDLRSFARLLDSAVEIPGTNVRVGLDPVLGLLPVAGDVPTSLVGAYVLVQAVRLDVPRETVARMVANLVVDAVVGSIPLVGDVGDVVWRAHDRNVALLEARLRDPDGASTDVLVVWGGTVLALVALLTINLAAYAAVWWVLGEVGLRPF